MLKQKKSFNRKVRKGLHKDRKGKPIAFSLCVPSCFHCVLCGKTTKKISRKGAKAQRRKEE